MVHNATQVVGIVSSYLDDPKWLEHTQSPDAVHIVSLVKADENYETVSKCFRDVFDGVAGKWEGGAGSMPPAKEMENLQDNGLEVDGVHYLYSCSMTSDIKVPSSGCIGWQWIGRLVACCNCSASIHAGVQNLAGSEVRVV